MVERVDCVVAGAGVVGLAIARALALAGHEVLILEGAGAIGTGTSSRNSEVIHAGMYYPPGSLKARLCVRGNRLLRSYLAERALPHRLVGKLIVATEIDEEARLEALFENGQRNGVPEFDHIGAETARRLEPELRCTAALLSRSTGILDSHSYMVSLQGDAEAHGATLALKSPILGGEVTAQGILLSVGGAEPTSLLCHRLVNAAGLGANRLALNLRGLPPDTVPPLYLCKGNYFLLGGHRPFDRLVYPLPESAGLGAHFTLDMGGQGRFGPDVEWVETETYEVDPHRGDSFYAAIRRYWPGLPNGALRPGYAGMRPKIQAPGEPARDFMVQAEADHGIPGLVNLYGIESPGLTASLAIAEHVTELLG